MNDELKYRIVRYTLSTLAAFPPMWVKRTGNIIVACKSADHATRFDTLDEAVKVAQALTYEAKVHGSPLPYGYPHYEIEQLIVEGGA